MGKAVIIVIGLLLVGGGAYIFSNLNMDSIEESLGYYKIYTEDEFVQMTERGDSGSGYQLMNDLDLEGYSYTTFSSWADFDGQGHTISGLDKPIFTRYSGTMKNVTLKGSSFEVSSSGMICSVNAGEIKDVECYGSLTTTGTDYCGGIAGTNTGTIESCVSYVDITGSAPSGGIVGKNSGTIENCTNYGDVSITTDCAGGIVSVIDKGTISAAKNYGDISSTTNCVGGIAGKRINSNSYSTSNCVVSDCTIKGKSYVGGIYGDISFASAGGDMSVSDVDIIGDDYLGGYAGRMQGTSSYNVSVKDISTSGTIKSLSDQRRSECHAGGLFGSLKANTVSNCSSTMDITITNYGSYVGGLIGAVSEKVEIQNCVYSGDLRAGSDYVGGIVGFIDLGVYSATIKDCRNEGTLTTTGSYIGGILGSSQFSTMNPGQMNVTSCSNASPISGNHNLGGIAGGGNIYADSCTNSVSISGKYAIGGIAGSGYKFTNCENKATITATSVDSDGSSLAGGICGYARSNFINCSNSGNVTSQYSSGKCTGGIAGYVDFHQSYSREGNHSNLGNSATISSKGDYVGGIFGYIRMSSGDYTLTDSSNTGELRALNSNYVGGLVGAAVIDSIVPGYLTIDSSSNSVPIKAKSYVGGYVGGGYAKVKNATNNCSIEGTSYVGGIAGSASTLTNCVNRGNITATSSNSDGHSVVGGIAGYTYKTDNLTGLHNYGVITGSSDYVGGIIGHCNFELLAGGLIDCHNHVNSPSSGTNKGGLVGYYNGLTQPSTQIVNCTNETDTDVGGGFTVV